MVGSGEEGVGPPDAGTARALWAFRRYRRREIGAQLFGGTPITAPAARTGSGRDGRARPVSEPVS